MIAPGSAEMTKEKFFAKDVEYWKQSKTDRLRFVILDVKTVKIVILTDTSFANMRYKKSRFGYRVMMADEKGNANVITYG